MRLIDADALKESIKRQADIFRAIGNEVLTEYADLIQTGFCQEVDNAPTIQSEIIRCKECLHNYGLRNNCEFNPEDIVCDYWSTDGLMADDYCSYGERRTDE